MEAEKDHKIGCLTTSEGDDHAGKLCSVVADLRVVIASLDELGLSLASARVSQGLDAVIDAIDSLHDEGSDLP